MKDLNDIDIEINEKTQELRVFYKSNNYPCKENPNGWINVSAENEYFDMLKSLQELKAKRSEILFSNIQVNVSDNSSINEMKKIRENSVTSSTYERSQRLLKRKVDSFYGVKA